MDPIPQNFLLYFRPVNITNFVSQNDTKIGVYDMSAWKWLQIA